MLGGDFSGKRRSDLKGGARGNGQWAMVNIRTLDARLVELQ